MTQLQDLLGLGKYRARVIDAKSGGVVFSRGFCSIYGEWETTGEARKLWRAFQESQRFPEPRRPFRLAIDKRSPTGEFHEIYLSADVDPEGRFVDRSLPTPRGEVITFLQSGDPATKVDLLFLADGYAATQRDKFKADVERLLKPFFGTEPYTRHRQDFNVRGLFLASPEAGISNPRQGVWRDSAFGCSFNSFDSDRYVLTMADRRIREAAAAVPYDAMVILCNERKYGGGGIYGLWSTCAADSSEAPYLLVHEFGHAFAGLADEYYTSQVAYEQFTPPGTEPWEPNVTALLDPKALKWRDLVETGVPLPTPWNQAAYDRTDLALQARRKELVDRHGTVEEMEALFNEARTATARLLAGEPSAGKVGAFEGAAYEAKGLYRPELDCIMFTRNPQHFCRVCERAIERVITAQLR